MHSFLNLAYDWYTYQSNYQWTSIILCDNSNCHKAGMKCFLLVFPLSHSEVAKYFCFKVSFIVKIISIWKQQICLILHMIKLNWDKPFYSISGTWGLKEWLPLLKYVIPLTYLGTTQKQLFYMYKSIYEIG